MINLTAPTDQRLPQAAPTLARLTALQDHQQPLVAPCSYGAASNPPSTAQTKQSCLVPPTDVQDDDRPTPGIKKRQQILRTFQRTAGTLFFSVLINTNTEYISRSKRKRA